MGPFVDDDVDEDARMLRLHLLVGVGHLDGRRSLVVLLERLAARATGRDFRLVIALGAIEALDAGEVALEDEAIEALVGARHGVEPAEDGHVLEETVRLGRRDLRFDDICGNAVRTDDLYVIDEAPVEVRGRARILRVRAPCDERR